MHEYPGSLAPAYHAVGGVDPASDPPSWRAAALLGPGGPDAADLRMLFHLPLRQTEGVVASLLRLMGLHLNAPDHTTLCRRNRDVLVPALRRSDDGPIHLIVGSTGLKKG